MPICFKQIMQYFSLNTLQEQVSAEKSLLTGKQLFFA
jgi:hypothetical protein